MEIPESLRPLEPEIRLGRTILDKAVIESLEDKETRKWFEEGSADFIEICFIANLDPNEVQKRFRETYKKLVLDLTIKEIERENSNDKRLPL